MRGKDQASIQIQLAAYEQSGLEYAEIDPTIPRPTYSDLSLEPYIYPGTQLLQSPDFHATLVILPSQRFFSSGEYRPTEEVQSGFIQSSRPPQVFLANLCDSNNTPETGLRFATLNEALAMLFALKNLPPALGVARELLARLTLSCLGTIVDQTQSPVIEHPPGHDHITIRNYNSGLQFSGPSQIQVWPVVQI